MKKLFAILLIAATVVSCNNAKEKTVDYAIVSGKITNNNAKVMEISSPDRTTSVKIPIDSEGNFSDTLRLDSGIYYFYDGRNFNQIHIDKGDHLNITYDAKDFKNTLKYSGEGSAISNYLLKKNAKLAKVIGRGSKVYVLNENEFKTKINAAKDSLLALLKEAKDLPADYAKKEKKDAQYFYLGELTKYQPYHAYYAQKKDFKVSDGFLDELKDFDYNNEDDFIHSQNYQSLVKSHYGNLAQKKAKEDSIDASIAEMQLLADVKSDKIKNNILNELAYNMKYADDFEEFYNTFMKTSTDEDAKKKITETYNKLKELAPGAESPKFKDYENFAGGTTSLDDLKGKYVYIDVWATWCGPCLAEIPSLKKMEEKYRGKNIQFVSISIDKKEDHDKWKKMVADRDLKGIQLYADNDWKSKFIQDYLITGIPHFILIDPQGKIVKYSAPRPSDPELNKLFQELDI